MSERTVGKEAYDLLIKNEKVDHTVVEQMREQLSDYEKYFWECFDEGKKVHSPNKPFYIVVLTKKERLMENVLRNYFFHRSSCPTPDYDQSVYVIDPQTELLELLWVLPAKDVCEFMRNNALKIDPSERQLLMYVLGLYDDSLVKKAKQLNGELELSPFLHKGAA